MTFQTGQRDLRALGGVLFAVFFIVGLVLAGILSSGSLPLPGAPAPEVASYYNDNRSAVLVSGLLQVLSAISLFLFASPVAAFAQRITQGEGVLPRLSQTGGVLSAGFLLLSALSS